MLRSRSRARRGTPPSSWRCFDRWWRPTDAVVLAPEFTITTPVVTAWLGAKIPIRGRFSAVLGASLDVATDRDRFTASTTGGTVTIFDPSGVRFGGVLALLLELTP